MGPSVAVELICQVAANMKFVMLKMGNHPIDPGIMGADTSMADRTAFDPARMHSESLV